MGESKVEKLVSTIRKLRNELEQLEYAQMKTGQRYLRVRWVDESEGNCRELYICRDLEDDMLDYLDTLLTAKIKEKKVELEEMEAKLAKLDNLMEKMIK